jgi:hypothetical protein
VLKLDLPVSAASAYEACAEHWENYASRQRRRENLDSLTPTVLSRYSDYLEHEGDPSALGSSSTPRGSTDGDFLYDCYASGNGADSGAVRAARATSRGYCPYCGLRLRRRPMNKNHESDHHLPRSVFPEFSILCVNLVSACHDCNEHKGAGCVTKTGRRRLLHPYFDDCLDLQLLECEVFVTPQGGVGVRFQLSPAAQLCAVFDVVEEHVEFFDLRERLADDVQGELVGLLQALATEDNSLPTVRNRLATMSLSRTRARPNDPVGLALSAAGRSRDLKALLEEARRRLPK